MTSRDFCYWLQGHLEIGNPKVITESELLVIKNHLNMVFVHEIDPSHSDDSEVQKKLSAIHNKLNTSIEGPIKNNPPGLNPGKLMRC